jgi:hypothetical protein
MVICSSWHCGDTGLDDRHRVSVPGWLRRVRLIAWTCESMIVIEEAPQLLRAFGIKTSRQLTFDIAPFNSQSAEEQSL